MSMFICLFLALSDFSVGDIQPLTTSSDIFISEPKALLLWQSKVYCVDNDSYLWVCGLNGEQHQQLGGKGQGPEELRPTTIALYPKGDSLEIIHGTGFAKSVLVDQKLLGRQLPEPLRYQGNTFSMTYHLQEMAFMTPGTFRINRGGRYDSFPLCDAEDELISVSNGILQVVSPEHIFIVNRQGLKRTFYYTLLSTQDGQIIGKGEAPLFDKRLLDIHLKTVKELPEGTTKAIADGATYSEQHGFVISEYTTNLGDHTSLHCIDPQRLSSKQIRVYYGQNRRLTNFLHIAGDTWVAYNGDTLVKVELVPR